jgi:hypothetical protein
MEKSAKAAKVLKRSQTGEFNLSPTMPATISVRQINRTGSVGSLKITMPTMMLPQSKRHQRETGEDRDRRCGSRPEAGETVGIFQAKRPGDLEQSRRQ